MAETVNVMVGAKFTLLGAELRAGYERLDNSDHFFILQDLSVPNDGVTIEKLVEDVKTLMGKTGDIDGFKPSDIQNKLTSFGNKKHDGTFKVDTIKILLASVYLDIVKPDDGKPATVDYAFRLDVDAKELIPADVKLINIDSLTLAVWNTENQAIKKHLSLSSSTTT